MNSFTNEELMDLIQKATAGDKQSLGTVMTDIQDLVFNLSLRLQSTIQKMFSGIWGLPGRPCAIMRKLACSAPKEAKGGG